MQTPELMPATHAEEHSYWAGGHYELNMSFDTLRDRQWQRLMNALWGHRLLYGPLTARYAPGATVTGAPIIIPAPTATQAQHGQLEISGRSVGCNVLATRSLFECVSVLVPLGMFSGIVTSGADVRRDNPPLAQLDQALYEIALAVYDLVPFQLATIGWERECQLVAELKADATLRGKFVAAGNFFVQDDALRLIGMDGAAYPSVRPTLRQAAPVL